MEIKICRPISIIGAVIFLTSFTCRAQLSFESNKTYRDTTIKQARLIDSISEKIIWALPDHFALLVRFEVKDSLGRNDSINVLIYAPEQYGEGFFQLNKSYSIYGRLDIRRIVFRPVGNFNDGHLMIRCDSIKVFKFPVTTHQPTLQQEWIDTLR